MAQFDSHFRMKEEDAIQYVKEKLDMFAADEPLLCAEIGDGNMNYVFRVENRSPGKSVIVKQADVVSRLSGNPASTDRNRIETEVLRLEGELAPGSVPELYLYDPVMCCTVMEDLKDYRNMRYELIAHHSFPRFSQDITTFLANTLIRTTDYMMEPAEKKEKVKRFINPGLCEITENLVFTDPYTDVRGKNRLNPENREFFERELYRDMELRLEAAKLKDRFMTGVQALIHGDLHTGSIFVNEGGTKVLDPEFACYGPAGYDVGNVIANLGFAWVNAMTTMEYGEARDQYTGWLEASITEVVDLFREKAFQILREESRSVMAETPGFAEWLVGDILADTAGYAGTEMNRRIVGSAKVKDIDGIEDPVQKARAERICVLAAKDLIKRRGSAYREGNDYINTLKHAIDLADGREGKRNGSI